MALHMIIGPMFAGKTTELIRQVRRHTLAKKHVIVVNHTEDTRYNTYKIVSHDGVALPSLVFERLSDFLGTQRYMDSDVIAIDEGQFFEDLFEAVLQMVEIDSKLVYVAGLNGTYKREPFGDILNLIPYSDNLQQLTAVCSKCGADALFSKRMVPGSTRRVVMGAEEMYTPVCREHFIN